MADQLRRLQLTQLEILKIFDGFCREHDLKYSLYAGSLLGAVRHRGFIPWDDDLDVCMPRADYDRFITLWCGDPRPGYLLQNKENTPGFTQSFTKLRKDCTAFVQYDWERERYHTGIFLDIFPADRMPRGKWRRRVFKIRCMLYQLLTREFAPPKGSKVLRRGSAALLRSIPKGARPKLRQQLLERITKYNADRTLDTVFVETVASLGKTYDPALTDAYVELPFEDGRFLCFENWHNYLTGKFGDYRTLPPEADRVWKHHPIAVGFDRNLEELE